jgi:hypothetical protein
MMKTRFSIHDQRAFREAQEHYDHELPPEWEQSCENLGHDWDEGKWFEAEEIEVFKCKRCDMEAAQ